MTNSSKLSSTSIRMTPQLLESLDRHVAVRNLTGENISRQTVINEALSDYLAAFAEEMVDRLRGVVEAIEAGQEEIDEIIGTEPADV